MMSYRDARNIRNRAMKRLSKKTRTFLRHHADTKGDVESLKRTLVAFNRECKEIEIRFYSCVAVGVRTRRERAAELFPDDAELILAGRMDHLTDYVL